MVIIGLIKNHIHRLPQKASNFFTSNLLNHFLSPTTATDYNNFPQKLQHQTRQINPSNSWEKSALLLIGDENLLD